MALLLFFLFLASHGCLQAETGQRDPAAPIERVWLCESAAEWESIIVKDLELLHAERGGGSEALEALLRMSWGCCLAGT